MTNMLSIRPSAIAGTFYPYSKQVLEGDVKAMLHQAPLPARLDITKALIVPHAGYIYSGASAAIAYARLTAVRSTIRRVVLLGPAHRVPVRGLALPGVDGFETPLGQVELDQAGIDSIAGMKQVVVSVAAHEMEHSLEIQLPFLQTVLHEFKLIPLAVGDATPEEVAEVLNRLWGGPETLIVISSDLSHFLPYHVARTVDKLTVQNILDLHGPITHEQACGGTVINGFFLAARQHQLQPELLDLRNSGDTAGDKNRVVGYASFAFTEGAKNDH
jgi:MEMO1 family protein